MSQQINLFNPIFLKQKRYFSAITMVQALGMILLGCVLVVAYTQYQLRSLEREAEDATAQLATAQAQLNQVNALYGAREKSKALEEELGRADGEVKALQKVFDILQKGEFGNTEGYSDYLRAFARQIVNGVWLTGVSIEGAGNEIGLKGRTLQPDLVPAYIMRLKREPALQGKAFEALDMEMPREKADSANQKKQVPNYIEFSLQSSAAMKERMDASGENKK